MTRQRIFSIARKYSPGHLFYWSLVLPFRKKLIMPVEGATRKSYSQNSFWAYPWGKSVTHKGVDIFAKRGTDIHPATAGIVIYKGKNSRGGNVVYILGPKWRIHYYAHLDKIKTKRFSIVSSKSYWHSWQYRKCNWKTFTSSLYNKNNHSLSMENR